MADETAGADSEYSNVKIDLSDSDEDETVILFSRKQLKARAHQRDLKRKGLTKSAADACFESFDLDGKARWTRPG